MKALVLKAYKQLVYEEAPVPDIGPEEVLVAVKACGICGSDVHGIDGSTGRRIPPIIMGHEASGVVAQTGSQVAGWSAGDRVTFDSTVYCGRCFFCRQGDINLCDNRRVLGVSCGDYRRHGAFAEYVAVPQHILYRLPEGLPFQRAAMVEALSIAFHAVHRTPLALNDSAVVIGAGMIGQLVIQSLRRAGCGCILAVDIDQDKLDLACKLGADVGINSAASNATEEILKLTDGRGAHRAFEAVGVAPAVETAIRCVRKGGTVTLVGNVTPQVGLPLQTVVTRELTLYGSCASRGEYPACLDMMSRGLIQVDPLISAVAPLSEGAAWFDKLYHHQKGLFKVILTPVSE